jgi:hypothetical protein
MVKIDATYITFMFMISLWLLLLLLYVLDHDANMVL